jgi:hypothetical protein
LLIEHAAHLILTRAWTSEIPFVVNGATRGRGGAERERISIDFSHLGDPLDLVRIRTAFSVYLRHQRQPELFGAKVASLPPLAVIPRDRQPLVTLLTDGRGLDVARQAAASACTILPDVTRGVARLLDDYRPSPLAAFHRRFLAERRCLVEPLPDWHAAGLAPRAVAPLEQPNPLLLRPGEVHHLVGELLAKGWKAAQIAALVERKFDEPHGWGDLWSRLDSRTRADFEVRACAGLMATGADPQIDVDCLTSSGSTR